MPTSLRPVAAGPLCAGHPEPCVSSGSNSRTGDLVDAAVLCVREEARELSWPTSLFTSRSGSQPQAPSSKPLERQGAVVQTRAANCVTRRTATGQQRGSESLWERSCLVWERAGSPQPRSGPQGTGHRAQVCSQPGWAAPSLPSSPAGPQPPWWDQHRCRAEGSRGAPDVSLLSSVCPCWAAAGVTSTVLLFLFVAAAAPDSLPPLQQGGTTRTTHCMELAGALPLPSCKPATFAATQVVTADLSLPVVFQGKQTRESLKAEGRAARSTDQSGDLWYLFWVPMHHSACISSSLRSTNTPGSTRARQRMEKQPETR
ncbi:uncharacterized protein [Macaca nemestrina]|uniref:uncharacterized protein isoform X1 n=1 Tax=Macaca nemestrina TaxID=9545 RepID=UPI0039B930BE